MTRFGTIVVAAVSLGAGVGSFFATRATQPAAPAAASQPSAETDTARPGARATDHARGPRRYGILARWLGLSPQQLRVVEHDDPHFAREAAELDAQLRHEQEKLAALLEAISTPDEQILEQLERVIAAHAALERRVARYVLKIRHHLSPDQQRRLLGLCASGVRKAAGRQWRGSRQHEGRRRGPGGRRGPRWQQTDRPSGSHPDSHSPDKE